MPRAAVEGDIVTLQYVCRDEDGNLIDDSREHTEPVLLLTKLADIALKPALLKALHVEPSASAFIPTSCYLLLRLAGDL